MKKLKLLLSIALIACCSQWTFGQDAAFKSINETQMFSKKATVLFTELKIDELIAELKKYSPLPDSELTELGEQTKGYIDMLMQRYGNIIGYEKVKNEKINSFAVRETYVIKHQYNAIRVIFTYYKNEDGWIVNSFNWDDSYSEEFTQD